MLQMISGELNEKRLLAAGRMSEDLVHMIETEIEMNKFEINDVQVRPSLCRNSLKSNRKRSL
jgi:hypothetical protein